MDLCKLTVPQLKALCKERRIVGYSKLGKAALIQKLNDAASSEISRKASTSGQGAHSSSVAYTTTHSLQSSSVTNPESCSIPRTRDLALSTPKSVPHHLCQPSNAVPARKPPEHPIPNKRSTHIGSPLARKRVKTTASTASAQLDLLGAYSGSHSSSPKHCVPPTPIPTSIDVFKAPAIPQRLLFIVNPELQESLPSGTLRGFSTQKDASQRFKPLTLSRPRTGSSCQPGHWQEATETNSLTALGSSPGMAFRSSPSFASSLSFVNISLPPSISDRRKVQGWAVILSGLDDPERGACCLVSRVIRYAGRRIEFDLHIT